MTHATNASVPGVRKPHQGAGESFRVRGFGLRVSGVQGRRFEGTVCDFGEMPGLLCICTQNTSSASSEGFEG